jgi:hypothetical protein
MIKSFAVYEGMGEISRCNSLASLPVNKSFNSLALDTSVPYPDVFFHGLKLDHYNFQLQDYSFFQFSYNSENDIRYAFYPSPYGPSELAQIQELKGMLEHDEIDAEAYTTFIQEINKNYSRSLIRYEYNTDQYRPGVHPASHFHIGTHGEDRWTVEKRLTPLAFSLLIGKLYFSHHWECLTVFNHENIRLSNEFDSQLLREKAICSVTPGEKFTIHDKSTFYFL